MTTGAEPRRLAILRFLLLAGFLALAARAAHLSAAGERRPGLRDDQVHTQLRLAPERGAIVDRRGDELAVSVRAPSIYVLPSALDDPEVSLRRIARSLGRPVGALRERLDGRRHFTYLARWVEPSSARAIEALDLPGVGVVWEPSRAYPAGELAASVLGFANIDGVGVRGIEQQEEEWLRGTARTVQVERDGGGRLLATADVDPLASAGGEIALTIDARLQAEAERALGDAVRATGAAGGSVVSVDPRSGEILALAEAPGFDPNGFRDLDFARTRARAFTDALEPGSTFKVFLVAAGLEAGVLEPDDRIDCRGGELELPGKRIRDRRDFGLLDPAGVLRVSSNVGAVRIAQLLGPEMHHAALRRFGFGEVTGSGFPAESAGLLRPAESWRPVDHATVAFGQGLGVTAVQLASATAALGNGGVWMRPRLVAARRPAGGEWQRTEPETVRRVVSPQTAEAVLRMMEGVVGPEGTGRLAGLDGVRVAGKTGTAQKLDRETGRYSRDRFIAWFIGVVPADDPRLAIVVSLDEPHGPLHSGGAVAAPLFGRVAAAQLTALGLPTRPAPVPAAPEPETLHVGNPDPDPDVEIDEPTAPSAPARVAARPSPGPAAAPAGGAQPTAAPARKTAPPPVAAPPPRAADEPVAAPIEVVHHEGRILLPDFRGLSLEEVMRITSQHDVELQVRGRGRAVEQDPQPGTIVPESNARIWVRFAVGDDAGDAGEG